MLAFNMFFLRAGAGLGSPSGWAVNPVTVVKKKFNATGDRWQITYSITGNSGYTLETRLKSIDAVTFNDDTITRVSWDQDGRLTFASSGAFTATKIIVVGNTAGKPHTTG